MTSTHGSRAGQAPGRFNARSLVEGALFAALASLFAIVGLLPPLFFVSLAIPVPLTIVGYRYGLRTAFASATVAVLLTFLLSGSPIAVGMVISAAAAGLVISYGVRRGFPAIRTVLLATAVSVVVWIVQFFWSLWVTGLNLWHSEVKLNRSMLDQTLKSLREMQKKNPGLMAPEQVKLFEEATRQFAGKLPNLWGMLIGAGSFVASVIDYGIIRASFRRLKLGEVPAFPPFKSWRLPDWVGGVALGAYGLGYAGALYGLGWATVAFDNLFYLCLYAFLIEGLAVAWYYFDKWGWDKVTRIMLVGFGFLTGIGLFILAGIGFLDIFMDYRQPREGEA